MYRVNTVIMAPEERYPEAYDWLTESDRKRSMLTRDDRRYLIGKKQLSGEAKRSADRRIQQRLSDGLRDLAFLVATANIDRINAAGDKYPPTVDGQVREFATEAVLANFYLFLYNKSNAAEQVSRAKKPVEMLEEELQIIIEKILLQESYEDIENIDVNINVDGRTDAEEYLFHKLVSGGTVGTDTVETYRDLGGDLEHLEEKLKEEDKVLLVKSMDPDGSDYTIP